MLIRAFLSVSAALGLLASPTVAAEKIVLRATNGRFLNVTSNESLRADALVPADSATFEAVYRGKEEVALRGPGGRFLTADSRDGRTPRLGSQNAEPGDGETFQLVPVAGGRVALRSKGSQAFLVPDPAGPQRPAAHRQTGKLPVPVVPSPGETVEIYRVRELPATLRTGVPDAVRALAQKELAGKQYDKTRSHKREKFVEVPAPTIHDLKRTKQVQVLGLTEEYRVQAQLDGEADVRIPAIVLLSRLGMPEGKSKETASWKLAPRESGLVLVTVAARLPVEGRAQYKVVDLGSASTGYRATILLSAVAEVQVERAGGDIALSPAEVLDLHVSVLRMEFSNNLLDAARRQIERFANIELRHNEARIRQKANAAIHKAISSREVRIPLLGYLGVL